MKPGDRVGLNSKPIGVALRSSSGTLVRPDPDYEGYWLVELDSPAWSLEEWDKGDPVPVIRWDEENLFLLESLPD